MITMVEPDHAVAGMTVEQLNRLIGEVLRERIQTVVDEALKQALGRATGNVDFFKGEPPRLRRAQRRKEQS